MQPNITYKVSSNNNIIEDYISRDDSFQFIKLELKELSIGTDIIFSGTYKQGSVSLDFNFYGFDLIRQKCKINGECQSLAHLSSLNKSFRNLYSLAEYLKSGYAIKYSIDYHMDAIKYPYKQK